MKELEYYNSVFFNSLLQHLSHAFVLSQLETVLFVCNKQTSKQTHKTLKSYCNFFVSIVNVS